MNTYIQRWSFKTPISFHKINRVIGNSTITIDYRSNYARQVIKEIAPVAEFRKWY
jgi:hypothetical protein